jgi:hypothetical protein
LENNIIPLASARSLKRNIELAKEGIRVNEEALKFLRDRITRPENAKIVPELNEQIISVQKTVAGLKRRLVEFKRQGGIT